MDDTVIANAGHRPAAPKRSPAAFFGDRSKQAIRLLGMVVVLAAVAVASASFLILTGTTTIEPTPEMWSIIWIVNGLLVLLVIALVLTEATLLLQARIQKQAGAGLQIRMVAMFAIVAAVPAALVAVVAMIALNQGLDQWFSERTRAMVEASRLDRKSTRLNSSHQ